MTTRSAVTPPEAAAWLVTKHPEFLEVLEREARGLHNAKVSGALLFAVSELRASGRDCLASLQDVAIAQLAGVDELPRPLPASVSVEDAAKQLGVSVRMVNKKVQNGPLIRAGRGRIDAVSLALEVGRRGLDGEAVGSEAG